MSHFAITPLPLDLPPLRARLLGAGAGAYASFEGWVRNHSEGRAVTGLYYEAYEALALAEGQRILAVAMQRYPIQAAACVHRVGELGLGELAVWVGVSAAHRGPAFEACRWIIDEVKAQVPIWKRERYAGGDAGWLHPDAGRGGDPAG